MPSPLIGPYVVMALMLVVAGGSKLVRPGNTAKALARAGVRHASAAVRVAAVVELAVGSSATVVPLRVSAAAVAGSYAVFTVVVLLARRNGLALATCGCFGEPDTPPTVVHAVLTGAASLFASGVALADPRAPLPSPAWLASPLGIGWTVALAATSYLAYLALSALARLQGAGAPARPGGPA